MVSDSLLWGGEWASWVREPPHQRVATNLILDKLPIYFRSKQRLKKCKGVAEKDSQLRLIDRRVVTSEIEKPLSQLVTSHDKGQEVRGSTTGKYFFFFFFYEWIFFLTLSFYYWNHEMGSYEVIPSLHLYAG